MGYSNQQLLDEYTNAEIAILRGQSVRMGERYLQRADLEFVQAERRRLQAVVSREAAIAAGGGSRFSQADFSGGYGGGEWTQA